MTDEEKKPCPCLECIYQWTGCNTDYCLSYLHWKVDGCYDESKEKEGDEKC